MPRPQINIPTKVIFSTVVAVQINQINYGGHLGNDSVLAIMHEARMRLFKSLGYQNEVEIEGGVGIAMTHSTIQYKAEAFHGDELRVDLGLGDQHKYGFDLIYIITNEKKQLEVARGETGLVGFDFESRKIRSVPAKLKNALNID